MKQGKFNTFLNYNANGRIYDIALFDKYLQEYALNLKLKELKKLRLLKLNKLINEE